VVSPCDDWPSRPDDRPRGTWGTRDAFDDVFAPDAYGVQLLGPGYAGRVGHSASWRRERAGAAGLILEHTDSAAWFGAPFLELGSIGRPEEWRQPPVLVQARAELAPILYTPGALSRAGYVEDESL
jgi:hypothetical protein